MYMKTNVAVIVVMLSVLASAPMLYADTYSWTDDNGTVNFTENRGDIPRKYRKQVKRLDDMSPDEPIIKSIPPKITPQTEGEKSPSKVGDSITKYNGKTYDQWKQELNERETSMSDIRKKIDELDVQYKKGSATPATIQERNRMVEKYNQLIVEYDKTVEAIRRAGLNVEIK